MKRLHWSGVRRGRPCPAQQPPGVATHLQEACLGLQDLQKKSDLYSVQGWALTCSLTLFPWVFLEGSAQTEGHFATSPCFSRRGQGSIFPGCIAGPCKLLLAHQPCPAQSIAVWKSF